MADILYSIRPAIGIYCWNNTIFKKNNEPMVPEEIISFPIEARAGFDNIDPNLIRSESGNSAFAISDRCLLLNHGSILPNPDLGKNIAESNTSN